MGPPGQAARVAEAGAVGPRLPSDAGLPAPQDLADLLEPTATGLLRGDLSAVPALRQARALRSRAESQARWGTATGEPPRFTARPTLPALFADAEGPVLIAARCTQAVHDWGFTRAELAAHLRETDDQVQGHLDRWCEPTS